MRLVFLIALTLVGCTTMNSRQTNSDAARRPTFPYIGRVPASAQDTSNVHIEQLFCPDGRFYFKAETSASNYPGNTNCFAMVEDDMSSVVTIRLNYTTKLPSGNFADVVLDKALNYKDRSYRDMPMAGARDYFVRGGQCGKQLFFVVSSASKSAPVLPVSLQNFCRFESEFRITSDLALAGVYPRVNGESLQSFVIKLTAK